MGSVGSAGGTPGDGSGGTTGGGPGNGSGGVTGGNPSTALPACTPGVPATTQLPRLTKIQYDNTVRDLFQLTAITSLPTQPSSMLAPDTLGSVDQRAWDGYKAAAETLATQVIGDATMRGRVLTCTPTGDGAACARTFIETFGKRAFRRPLATEEIDRFVSIYTNRMMLTATGAFNEAITLITRAILASPSFITKAEIAEQAEGTSYVLNGWEVASRLSYMLWNTMPDEALFTAAQNGKLGTAAGILEEARRMIMDAKARSKVTEFHQAYAHMGEGTRWADIDRDRAVYPAFTPALGAAMADETRRFFEHIVFEQSGSFKDLLTSPVAFVNSTLAPIYGLPPGSYGADLTPVTLDGKRPGVFTRVGFLTANSLYNRPSPIHRGAFLQKDVLCAQVGSPPPGAEGTPLPTTGASNRERVDAQTAGAGCASCHHALINPTGFALEAFDGIGAFHETEGNMPVNTMANVPIGATTVAVKDAADLMQKIAASPEGQQCYTQKLVQFAFERSQLTGQDACTVKDIAARMSQGGDSYSVLAMIADLTQSQTFRYRAKE